MATQTSTTNPAFSGDKNKEKFHFSAPNFSITVLVDALDMVRGQMNLKRLSLTDITVENEKVPKKSTLIAGMEAAGTATCSMC